MTYNPAANLALLGNVVSSLTADTDFETVKLNGYDTDNGHSFTVTKKKYAQTFSFYADLRYWPAFGDPDQQSSGAYIFRVTNGTTKSIRYSQF